MIERYSSLQTHVRRCWIVLEEIEDASCKTLQPKLVQLLWVVGLGWEDALSFAIYSSRPPHWCGTGDHKQVGGRAVPTLPPKSHPSSCFLHASTCFLQHLICLNASCNLPWWEVWVSSTPVTAWAASLLINSCSSARKSACVCLTSGVHLQFTYCKYLLGKI